MQFYRSAALVGALAAAQFVLAPAAKAQATGPLSGPGTAQSADLVEATEATALDEYVAAEDDAYDWSIVGQGENALGRELVVELTSQTWRTAEEVNRTEWKHWLILSVPKNADPRTALLFISGGSNGGGANEGGAPNGGSDLARQVAVSTGSVVAELRMVPNQPLEFFGDGHRRHEDDLLAYTWNKYLETGDPTWVGQLPMAKSAVRAMDAVQEVLADQGGPAIERFVVTGGSKRGWTTWLAAIVDDRVAAIAPMVIDVLNIQESMRHHFAVYGFWSPALGDYERQGLQDRLDDPRYQEILDLVDPYAYRERLALPKCLINAAGDEFFLPDSSRYYFQELPGEKHLCYVPNTGHSLAGSTALDTLIAFHYAIVHDVERPNVAWEKTANGYRVTCDARPERVLLWRAENSEARDFRLPVIGKAYESRELAPETGGGYVVELQAPDEGWSASFVEMTFDIGAPRPLRFSTPVWVTPDTEPFAKD